MKPFNGSTISSLALLPAEEQKAALQQLTDEELLALDYAWRIWARPNQLAPEGDWSTWLIMAGRGFGKTRSGAEWVRELVEGDTPTTKTEYRRIALVGETLGEVRKVMIEGESGLLSCCPPDRRPIFESSKRLVTWPNGATAEMFSAEDPDSLRGPQFHAAWCDEFAKWRYPDATWDMLMFGLRLGKRPLAAITSTPRPIKKLKEILALPDVIVTRGSTYENRENLAPAFFKQILRRYEGTRLGRQEIEAHLLDDDPSALWARSLIDRHRVTRTPENLQRVVVAIDPPTTSGEDADECGIVVAGIGRDGHAYVLADLSIAGLSPMQWAQRAVGAYHTFNADRVVAETNNGGEMVEATIRQIERSVAYRAVHAMRGKVLRAEPISALYEQGKVHHVGTFAQLEDQMCVFTSDYDPDTMGSPDRVDALVWALTDLMLPGAAEPRFRRL